MTALQDEEVQRRGVCMVYYGVGQTKYFRDRPFRIVSTWFSIPMKIVAAHACYDNPILRPLMNLASFAMERALLCRFRTHEGKLRGEAPSKVRCDSY